MSKLIFISVLIAFGFHTLFSQQQTVTGRLIDQTTKKPIKGAIIKLLRTNIKTESNALGFFQLQADTTSVIEITAQNYLLTQIKIPSANSFKVELTLSLLDKKEEIISVIEEPATFPGGITKFYDFINKNMKKPQKVASGTIEGKVFVNFVIDSTGYIPANEIKIERGLCQACDEEAIRLIKTSPKWIPGKQGNKAVRQRMVIPILFRE